MFSRQWEVIALERLTSNIEQEHNNRETRVAYDNNSTWHAINTGYINSTKETTSKKEIMNYSNDLDIITVMYFGLTVLTAY